MDRFKLWVLMLSVLLIAPSWNNPFLPPVNPESLPHRNVLRSEIQFWKIVFTRLNANQMLIHDNEYLSVQYKTITLDTTLSKRQQARFEKAVKKEIETLLLRFHNKNFTPEELTPWEKGVLKLFDTIKEPNKFLKASRRIRGQQGIRERFMGGVTRSFAYLPYIKEVFEEEGLPRELIYLPHVESSFNPKARSHVGATGMWQFMRPTARQFMKVNNIRDERYDPLTSTRAAARLLKSNYRVLKDWALAITAYNHGLGGMRRAKRRYGGYMQIRDKYLRRSFGFASKNFYPEFVAVVEIMDSLSHFFPDIERDPVVEFKEIKLPRPVRFTSFAKNYGIDPTVLSKMNPGFRRSVLKGTVAIPARYTLRLPVTANAELIMAALGATRDHIDDVRIVRKADPSRVVLSKIGDIERARQALARHLSMQRPGVVLSSTISRWTIADAADFTVLARDANSAEVSEAAAVALPSLAVLEGKPGVASRNLPADLADAMKIEIPAREVPIAGSQNTLAITLEKPEVHPQAGVPSEHISNQDLLIEEGLSAIDYDDVFAEFSATASLFNKAAVTAAANTEVDRPTVQWWMDTPQGKISEEDQSLAFTKASVVRDGASVAGTPDELQVYSRNDRDLSASGGSPIVGLLAFEKPTVGRGELQNPQTPAFIVQPPPMAQTHLTAKPQATRSARPSSPGVSEALRPAGNYEIGGHSLETLNINKQGVEAAPLNFNPGQDYQLKPLSDTRLSISEIRQQLRLKLAPQNEVVWVYPEESLGHYSDWLYIPRWKLRRINNFSGPRQLDNGDRIQLDFSRVDQEAFLEKRLAFHVAQLEELLGGRSEVRLISHQVRSGENLWNLAHKRFKFPVNLLLYFNDLNKLQNLYPGDIIKLPILD